ncbi:MAG: sulfatase-like hydrolase/transferase [Verrucomicrobiales bacterium]|nr:sulfatase-like hydrolase/transferase [Verrucomicrobiales bacterium]
MKLFRLLIALLLAPLAASPAAEARSPARPNIVFLLSDDHGYGDVSRLNPRGRIPTPHLDRLAREGLRLTDAHSGSSVCTPTRYGLLTGRYAWRSKLKNGVLGGLSPHLIEPGRMTVASMLRAQGYHTACIGKWHLGMDWVVKEGKTVQELGIESPEQVWNVDFSQPILNGPNRVGFDYFFGISASLDMVPYTYIENDRVSQVPDRDGDFPWVTGRDRRTRRGPAAEGFDAANVLGEFTRRAVACVGQRAAEARRGQPFFLYVPLASPHTPILPTGAWRGKSGVNAYADFVMETDASVGQILRALDDHGLAENTVVLFAADNGCSPEADFPELAAAGHHPSGPFRGHKADLFEGGHRVPFFVRWPGQIKAGAAYSHPVCLTDLLATCAELLEVKLPDDAAEDSVSLLPVWLGRTREPVRSSIVHHSVNGSFAIRQGRWKLLLCPDSGGWSAPRPGSPEASGLPPVQLYDLSRDPGEEHNLQAQHPEVVRKLAKLLEEQVARGRSTPGPIQSNHGQVDIRRGQPADVSHRRPNILFVFADDWGRHASAYAKLDGPGTVNDLVRTPHFDRVAREGVLFRSAFVSAPSCTPCRSALLSGQHFWRTGRASILRGAVWDGSNPSWPLLLRDAGYHVGETYKVWSPGTPNDAPYGAGQYAFEKAGRKFNQFSQNVTAMAQQGQSVEASKEVLYDEVRGNFDAFLAARRAGQPFCYWFGPGNVHRSWTRGSGKALWGLSPDDLKGKMPPFLADVPEVREDLADYFGEAMAFDAALGVLLRKIEAIGELDNTLVIVSGDHGAPGFPHGKCNLYDFGSRVPLAIRWSGAQGGRVVDDLITLPDLAPTILALAGVPVPKVMTGRSLMPLLISSKSGQVDPARTAVFIGRERHVENARDGYLPYPQRAVRTHDHLLIINFKPDRWPLGEPYRLDGDNAPTAAEIASQTRVTLPDEDAGPAKAWLIGVRHDPKWKPLFELAYAKRPRVELYDLKSDPHQVKNVAGQAGYADVQAALEKRLLDELRQTGDPRLVDDGKFYETPPMAGPTADVETSGGKSPEELRSGRPRSPSKRSDE